MQPKRFIPLQAAFLLCAFVSGLDYSFGIGRWKSYVRLFGWLELLLTAAGVALLTALLVKKGRTGAAPALRGITVLLWLMQFCPALYALMLGGSYFWYALFHWACILLGGSLLFQRRTAMQGGMQTE